MPNRPPERPVILALSDCETIALAGGKGANLGALARTGQPVPDGFVVTTEALAGVGDVIGDPLAHQIRRAYRELGEGPVAVRSSATAEDLPGATFAGQQDTFLSVEGPDAVVAAVLDCCRSLHGERAVAYRERIGLDDDRVAIAVVVQQMVPAEVAGVMFTADPVTGRRDRYAIDAHPGLGEAVVSGEVIPDHFTADTSGHIENWTSGEAGSQSDPQPVLSPNHVRDLVTHGRQIAAHFGRPQDIEWAIADDQVHILQARPMTALPPPPVELSRTERLMASIILDYVTVRPYPLDVTTWVPYGPIGMMARLSEDIGVVGAYDRLLQEEGGVVTALEIQAPRPVPRLLTAPMRVLPRIARHDPARWAEDPRAIELHHEVDRLRDEDVTALTRDDLLARVRECFGLSELVTGLRRDFLPGSGAALGRLRAVLAVLGQRALGPDLTQGAPTQTTAGNTALAELAALAREDPELVARIEAGDLAAAQGHSEFGAAFGDWLTRYGYRETSSPVLVSQPTLAESPETALALVRVLLDPSRMPRDSPSDPRRELLMHPLLRSWRLRRWVGRTVDRARAAVAFREDSHAAITRIAPVLRATLLELGRRLADEGILDDAADVWHCRWDELVTVPRGDLRRRVEDRRLRREALAGVPLINIVTSSALPTSDALVVGTPASRGSATGPVRVVRGPQDFGSLRSGEVLVCPYTNPSWTPLFQRAAAVVVDSGGSGSHAAIVAREYGIPAVMGTSAATRTLVDGQIVTVDGDHGLVTRGRQSP